jgi:hypothetical protein
MRSLLVSYQSYYILMFRSATRSDILASKLNITPPGLQYAENRSRIGKRKVTNVTFAVKNSGSSDYASTLEHSKQQS